MSVEQLLSPEERENFMQRQLRVLEAADYYGLTPENAIVVGGGALALHNLDTYIPPLQGQDIGFDIDIILIQEEKLVRGWRQRIRKPFIDEVVIKQPKEAPLPITLMRGRAAAQFATEVALYDSYQGMISDRREWGGIAMPSVGHLIASKNNGGRFKDRAGLIKAHLVAYGTDHRVTIHKPWEEFITIQIEKIVEQARKRPDPSTPAWLDELLQNNFDHPAFDGIRPVKD